MAADLSVVIPALDAAATIERAIGSVLSVEPDAEIVVVDDGSTDDTATVAAAASPNVRVGRSARPRGAAAARNHGLVLADRPIIGFVDADDTWLPAAGERLTALRQDPDLDLVVGLTQALVDGEPLAEPYLMGHHGAVLLRRSALISAGGFDEHLRTGEDLDWFLRARATAAVLELEVATYEYRMRPGSVSSSPGDRREGLLRAAAQQVARRRGTAPASAPPIGSVSVIMAVHDGIRFIDAALDSIQAQTRPVQEVLVVDSGSTDGTRERVAERHAADPRIQLLDPQGPTLADQYNTGITLATGDAILWLAHDDEWEPGAVAALVDRLDGPPSADLVHGLVRYFADPGTTLPPSVRVELVDTVQSVPIPECRAVRRSLFPALGGHRPAVSPSDDADWFARALDAGIENVVADKVVTRKRMNPAGITNLATPAVHTGLLTSLHESIQRKRAAR